MALFLDGMFRNFDGLFCILGGLFGILDNIFWVGRVLRTKI